MLFREHLKFIGHSVTLPLFSTNYSQLIETSATKITF